MQNKIVLLLTGTINIQNKMFTAFTDKEKRKADYIDTLYYYLKTYKYPIVFVENSNQDISALFSNYIKEGRLEVLTFDGNNYEPELGKGLGEMRCMEHAMNESKMITPDSFVFKITGRYKILNLPKYIQFYEQDESIELMADLTNNFKLSASSFFGFKPKFAFNYLLPQGSILNDSENRYFEHILAKAILIAVSENINFRLLKYYPKISAISGTTAKRYKKSFFHYFPRNMKYLLRYSIMKR